ncbi:MAG: periplasmic heavy metal sensor [Bacteroidales bacterium]|nr:periplasmic heavy metal sensor [Bacteroidales bacterium]MBN2819193.1 periplasmic heavy metal sensor [Bacteroidales bacterium]
MKRNWIYITIIFLLTANLALLATSLILKNRDKTIVEGTRETPGRLGSYHQEGSFENHLAKHLEMTPEQIEQLEALGDEFHNNKKDLGRAMYSLKKEYFDALANDNPDEDYLRNLADSIGAIHVKLMIEDHNHYKDIRSVCSPVQARKMDSLGKEYMHKHKLKNDGYHRRHGSKD